MSVSMEDSYKLQLQGRDPSKVRELTFDNCKATEITVLNDQLVNLESLSVRNVGLTSLEGLPKLPLLKKLDISGNGISKNFGPIAQNCPQLLHLNLCNNSIRGVGELIMFKNSVLKELHHFGKEHNDRLKTVRANIFKMIPSLEIVDGFDVNGKMVEDDLSSNEDASERDTAEKKETTNDQAELTKLRQLCEDLKKEKEELKFENERLKTENQQGKEHVEKIENENHELNQRMVKTKGELENTAGKLTKLSDETREKKKMFLETVRENGADRKTEKPDQEDCHLSDESMLDYEWGIFKRHFNELEKKMTDLSMRAFSTRNSRCIGEIGRKVVEAADVSSKVKDDVLATLKNGGDVLKEAFDELCPLDAQFPESSSA